MVIALVKKNKIKIELTVKLEFFFLVGSHICGFASSKYNKFDRISALDPAGPHFYQKPINQRLDPTDAKFVDAYHTNDGDGISSGWYLIELFYLFLFHLIVFF